MLNISDKSLKNMHIKGNRLATKRLHTCIKVMYLPFHHVHVRTAENLKKSKFTFLSLMKIHQVNLSFSPAAKCTCSSSLKKSFLLYQAKRRSRKEGYVMRSWTKVEDCHHFTSHYHKLFTLNG